MISFSKNYQDYSSKEEGKVMMMKSNDDFVKPIVYFKYIIFR